jgi:hypothetical protein
MVIISLDDFSESQPDRIGQYNSWGHDSNHYIKHFSTMQNTIMPAPD